MRHFDESFTKMDPFSSYTTRPDPTVWKLSNDMWSSFDKDPDYGEFEDDF